MFLAVFPDWDLVFNVAVGVLMALLILALLRLLVGEARARG